MSLAQTKYVCGERDSAQDSGSCMTVRGDHDHCAALYTHIWSVPERGDPGARHRPDVWGGGQSKSDRGSCLVRRVVSEAQAALRAGDGDPRQNSEDSGASAVQRIEWSQSPSELVPCCHSHSHRRQSVDLPAFDTDLCCYVHMTARTC